MKEILIKLSEFKDLTKVEVRQALDEITEGRATDALIGAFIMGTKMKGETPGSPLYEEGIPLKKLCPL